MDPASGSYYDLSQDEKQRSNINTLLLEEEKHNEKNFAQILGSCTSISRYEKKSFKNLLPQIIATLATTSLHLAIGMGISYSAILVPQLQSEGEITLTKSQISWLASITQLAAPIGTLTSGFLMDSIGRLNAVKLATVPGIVGWLVIATSTNYTMLICGRVFVGLSSALGSTPIVVYITEIARADMRGSLISVAPALTSLGMIILYSEGWFATWRVVAYTSTIFLLIPLILINFIPDSPLWLISRNRYKEAKKSIEWINKYQPQPENKTDTFATLQLSLLQREHEQKKLKIVEQNRQSTVGKGGTWQLKAKKFLEPTGYKPFLILIGLFAFQQFSGIFILISYSVTFFTETGTTINPYLASILIGVIRFSMALTNTYTMKLFNKRPLILISGLAMAVSIALSGLFTHLIKNGSTTQTWMPVVCLLVYVMASMAGVTPVPATMTAELFPIEIRGVACGLARSINNLLLFLAVKSYPSLFEWCGGIAGVQWFFAGVLIVGVAFNYVLLPETKGKKLIEIEDYFNHHTFYLCSRSTNNNDTIDDDDDDDDDDNRDFDEENSWEIIGNTS